MAKRTSRQKMRHATRCTADEDVLEHVIKLAGDRAGVISISGEMHGDWNQFAIFIELKDSIPCSTVVALEHELFVSLSTHFAARKFGFSWTVGLWRGGEPVSMISPHALPGGWCEACQSRYSSSFAACPRCSSAAVQ